MDANGYIRTVADSEGVRRRLIANPVQFDEEPPATRRAPQFAEHTDDLLRGLGHSEEQIIQLKIDGVITWPAAALSGQVRTSGKERSDELHD
jgi:crotonobetainyl-CoA:carnitine CoA-transferase CaiB-like acyl-CoA transferase